MSPPNALISLNLQKYLVFELKTNQCIETVYGALVSCHRTSVGMCHPAQ